MSLVLVSNSLFGCIERFVSYKSIVSCSNPNFKYLCRKMHMENHQSSNSTSRGALIVLEGLDRCGKTSQSRRLHSYLEDLGCPVELWSFPDRSTSVGQLISDYLLNKSHLDDHTIHLLFSANRWEKRSLMEAKLKSGYTLIVDRYSYSGVAFSSAKGLDIEWCKAPEKGLLAPDVVVYLDIMPEEKMFTFMWLKQTLLLYTTYLMPIWKDVWIAHVSFPKQLHWEPLVMIAAERGGYGGERYEQLEFQKKVAQSYRTLFDPSWKIVDATSSTEAIEKQLRDTVLDYVMTCRKGKSLPLLWCSN